MLRVDVSSVLWFGVSSCTSLVYCVYRAAPSRCFMLRVDLYIVAGLLLHVAWRAYIFCMCDVLPRASSPRVAE